LNNNPSGVSEQCQPISFGGKKYEKWKDKRGKCERVSENKRSKREAKGSNQINANWERIKALTALGCERGKI
jgi:hypothetical protein